MHVKLIKGVKDFKHTISLSCIYIQTLNYKVNDRKNVNVLNYN